MITINHPYGFFIILFCIASFLFQKSTYVKKDEIELKKTNAYNVIGIALLSIIASIYIGYLNSDIYYYEYTFYRNEQLSYIDIINGSGDNVLFYIIGKFIYSYTGKIGTFLVFDLIIVIMGYLFVKDKNYEYSIFIGALIFCTGLYRTGAFNMFKQGVAISIILFAIQYVYKNNLFKFMLCVIVASLFHGTAIIALVIWLFWDHHNNTTISVYRGLFLVSVVSFFLLGYNKALIFLSTHTKIFDEYTKYSNQIEATNRDFYVNLLILAIILVFSSRLIKIDNKNQLMIYLFIISIFVNYLGFKQPFIKRIGSYFMTPAKITLLGYLPSVFDNKSKMFVKIIIVISSLIVFYLSTGDDYILQFGIIQRSFERTCVLCY